jgi:hypothetical protein
MAIPSTIVSCYDIIINSIPERLILQGSGESSQINDALTF